MGILLDTAPVSEFLINMETPFPTPFFLAPMAEVSTPALRRTVKSFSPEIITFSEMLSAAALISGGEHNLPLMKQYEFDDPYIYQILGNSEKKMGEACRILSEKKCFSIDINMGCSAPDIINKGSGAALFNDIQTVKRILKSCRKAVKTRLSVKMRTGFESSDKKKLLDFVRMLKDEGVDFITVHPRYARISFKRKADWELIGFIRDHVEIPVIGNGDIKDPQTGIDNMRRYGCSGIMIGREAVKSPWIFSLCSRIEKGDREISMKVNIQEVFIRTLLYMKSCLPPNLHKSRSRRFCFYYTGNLKFGHQLFSRIREKENIDHICDTVNAYFERNPHEIFREFHIRQDKKKPL